jgi:multimeric flavodoxin WrbA
MADTTRVPELRRLQPSVQISKEEFTRRLTERFADPAFDAVRGEIARIVDIAWDGYDAYRKWPRSRKAGPDFADPEVELAEEWLAARDAIQAAQRQHDDPAGPARILVISAAARSDHTCPGESPKTYRLAQLAREIVEQGGASCDFLDLSHLTAEYGRVIHPCKACVSTAMPLCHWPCSCYPNHAMGQVQDWMNEIYPRWVAAHGVMIVTPVYWYQAPSTLKLMMDRLVCADGGNPDPTTTKVKKDPTRARQMELEGWSYPRHLRGRAFAVVVHGDTVGAETLRRSLADWLTDMELVSAGRMATLDRYVGWYEPYPMSHEALDRDTAIQDEVRNAARALLAKVALLRSGRREPDEGLSPPRPK